MLRRLWVPVLFVAVTACAEGGPVAPADEAGLSGDEPLVLVLPDLTPELGTAGTDRYVPTLERILRRAVSVIRDKRGDEAAGEVVATARSLADSVRAARQAGDTTAMEERVQQLEGFEARIGLRVFGVGLVRHVHGAAADRLGALSARLRVASAAGRDVGRLAEGAKGVRRYLAAAQDAAGNGRPVAALVHAAHALDLVTRLDAAL